MNWREGRLTVLPGGQGSHSFHSRPGFFSAKKREVIHTDQSSSSASSKAGKKSFSVPTPEIFLFLSLDMEGETDESVIFILKGPPRNLVLVYHRMAGRYWKLNQEEDSCLGESSVSWFRVKYLPLYHTVSRFRSILKISVSS